MNHERVLVTGGAGYIGSHAVLALRDAGAEVVVIDNLNTGFRQAVPADVPLIVGDIADRHLLASVMKEHGVTAVMHFAGSLIVPESVEKPLDYYANNTMASLGLIRASIEQGVNRFVFSSTAAVYGQPETSPISEATPTRPINPYGNSKLMTEQILRDGASVSSLRYVALRYFNVAGADPAGRAGQSTDRATHLIKVAAEAAVGRRPEVTIFGTDYPTPDGTCIRDYIHVSDLADAHVLSLAHLAGGGDSLVLNCGYGHGYSVREVLSKVEEVNGAELPVRPGRRRAGDPASLVADNRLILERLSWRPRYNDLDTIVSTALAWERRLAQADQSLRATS